MISVFLVDDMSLVRTGIKLILETTQNIKVIGEADSGEEAVEWCRKRQCDVILMDMVMPGIGGLEATKKILRYNPDAKIIVLTIQTEEPYPTKIMQAGASGFLTKGAEPDEMIKAIKDVAAGKRFISPSVAQQIALSNVSSIDTESPFKSLSERELQITEMIAKGLKAGDIADKLNLSPKTVNSYRYRIFDKLNLKGDVELTRLAIRCGIVQDRMRFLTTSLF